MILQYLHRRLACEHQLRKLCRKEILTLHLLTVLIEPCREILDEDIQVLLRKTEHVHGNDGIAIDLDRISIAILAHKLSVRLLRDVVGLVDLMEIAALAHHADTPIDGAVIREGIPHDVTGHAHIEDRCILIHGIYEIVMDQLESLTAVEVVRIDYSKRRVDEITYLNQCMRGTPRLLSALRHTVALRQLIDLLEGILTLRDLLDTVADDLAEILLDVLTDDKHNLIKSGFQCIVDGIIHDDLTARSQLRQLFDTTAETGSQTCCHNYQCRFFHFTLLPLSSA